MAALPAIEVSGLGKSYRRGVYDGGSLSDAVYHRVRGTLDEHEAERTFMALRDVDFAVPAGCVMGVIGANGSGKTTLMKILAGITMPTTGRAILRGRLASMLEAGGGFEPELTGRENIYLSGAITGIPRRIINERFDRIVEFAGLADSLDNQVKRYSSGMYARLAMALAVHVDAQILLLDEILAKSDRTFRDRCVDVIRRLAGEGRTIMFVSHNMELMRQACDTAIMLDAGRVVGRGTPEEVAEAYYAAQRR